MKATGALNANGSVSATSSSVWVARGFATARYLLGALLLFSVANVVFHFVPQPPMPAAAQAFFGGLLSAPYFLGLLKGTEFLVALAVLSNRFVPLALVVLAPITINVVLFHFVLAPEGAPVAVALLVLHLITAWSRRDSYRTVLAAK
jgi:hypothetical protein